MCPSSAAATLNSVDWAFDVKCCAQPSGTNAGKVIVADEWGGFITLDCQTTPKPGLSHPQAELQIHPISAVCTRRDPEAGLFIAALGHEKAMAWGGCFVLVGNGRLTEVRAMNATSINRRQFLGRTASVAAFAIASRHGLGGANDKLNIAGIGIGGMGAGNLQALDSQNIVALCDVDPDYAARTIQRYPQARVWTDYREMLDKQKDIEAVLIATPDHTHAVISAAAMRAGKHVYCQKPLTHDVYEARRLAEIARETGVATQMGNQGHSGEGIRSICEWIWDGAIGEVRTVDAWCSLSYYPWGHAGWSSKWGTRPTDTPALPDRLSWDLWLGPAPSRSYHPAYHPAVWRCWWDFGCGMMGDRGAHTLDAVVWALKLGPPLSVEATSCGLNPDTHPLSAIVTYRFAARGSMPALRLTWYEGTRPPRPEDMDPELEWPPEGGALFHGSKGKLICGVYGQEPRLVPQSLHKAYVRPAPTLPRIAGSHEMDWVRACKTGQLAGSAFGCAGPLTETCLLGNIAKRIDGRIEWDPASLKVTNLPEANRYVRTEYRAGWSL